MSDKIVLITGINGYLASNTGMAALKAGYILRGTCRSQHKVAGLLAGPWKEYASRIQIYVVPDICSPGAFDEAVKGVHAILHMAAPTINPEITKASTQLIEPTVNSTKNIMEAALTHAGPELKIFVFTSSAAACITPGAQAPYVYTDDSWNVVHPELVEKEGDNCPIFVSYPVAKIRAEKYVWSVHREKPSFSVASICGSIATGPTILFPESEDAVPMTCKSVLDALCGKERPGPQDHIAKIAGSAPYADIRDLAQVYLWCAENPQDADGQRYLVVAGHGPRQAVYDILRKHYPERAEVIPKGDPSFRYNEDGTFDSDGVRFDSEKVKKHTGLKFRSYEQTITETAEFLSPFWRGDK